MKSIVWWLILLAVLSRLLLKKVTDSYAASIATVLFFLAWLYVSYRSRQVSERGKQIYSKFQALDKKRMALYDAGARLSVKRKLARAPAFDPSGDLSSSFYSSFTAPSTRAANLSSAPSSYLPSSSFLSRVEEGEEVHSMSVPKNLNIKLAGEYMG